MHRKLHKFCTFLFIFVLINLMQEIHAEGLSTSASTSTPLPFQLEQDGTDEPPPSLTWSTSTSRYPFGGDIRIPPGLIPDNYDNFIRPTPHNYKNKTVVSVQLSLHGIRGLNEKDGVLTLLMDLQFYWIDRRLNTSVVQNDTHHFSPLDPRLLRYIWHPHLYIPQLVSNEQPGIINPPQYLRMSSIIPVIYYVTRSTVGIACSMNYTFYPKDLTTCTFVLGSYMYSDKTLELNWLDYEALNVTSLKLPGFEVLITKGKTLEEYNWNWTAYDLNEVSSRLKVIISLRRHVWDQLLRTYIPSSSFVFISWCSFLIPKDNALERTGIALGSLLSLMVLHNSVGQTISHVTELTALHVWVLACILFVFLPLIETLIVIKLWSMQNQEKVVKKRNKSSPFYKMRRVIIPTCCSFKPIKTIGVDLEGGGARGARGGADESRGFAPMNMNFGLDLTNPNVNGIGNGLGHAYSNTYEIPNSNTKANDKENSNDMESGTKSGRKIGKIADMIERVTRMFLPAAFLLFNSAYWPWMLNGTSMKPTEVGRMYEVPNYF